MNISPGGGSVVIVIDNDDATQQTTTTVASSIATFLSPCKALFNSLFAGSVTTSTSTTTPLKKIRIDSLFGATTCSPPQNNLELEEVAKKCRKPGIDFNKLEESNQRLISYLFAKGIIDVQEQAACELLKLENVRTSEEEKLLQVMSKRSTSKDLKQVLKRETNENVRATLLMTRCDKVLSKAELVLSKDHEDVQSFIEFMASAKLSGWEESNMACSPGDTNLETSRINKRVVMAFCEHGLTPFSRVQHGSVCYVHAPVMLVQYLCYLQNPEDPELADPGQYMINISQWMRNSLTASELWERIFLDKQGGSSIDVLTRILAKSGTPEVSSLTNSSFKHHIQPP
jgi:hypothetical protein